VTRASRRSWSVGRHTPIEDPCQSVPSSVLWFLVLFLPILSGTIADQIGFRRALLIAFVLLTVGYSMMACPMWLGGSTLNPVSR
jgi:ammonia channel protein AmtB